MLWIEMSFDTTHGGGEWGFLKCLWSPTRNIAGGKQGWWEIQSRVKAGDRVLHLRGTDGADAHFVGTSICQTDCQVTLDRPPEPGEWGFAKEFFRTPIAEFESLEEEVPVAKIFQEREVDLRSYFKQNKARPKTEKLRLFYVIQRGALQCQNGAYFSEVDVELAEILLQSLPKTNPTATNVIVGERLYSTLGRIKQEYFSSAVRDNFNHVCCFPNCNVSESRFLVGAHIARWCDVPELRGEISNGLCFCLMHDKAFECGLFTIDETLSVRILPQVNSSKWASTELVAFEGHKISKADIQPSEEALLHHWLRVGF
jgi:hypothetical protein